VGSENAAAVVATATKEVEEGSCRWIDRRCLSLSDTQIFGVRGRAVGARGIRAGDESGASFRFPHYPASVELRWLATALWQDGGR